MVIGADEDEETSVDVRSGELAERTDSKEVAHSPANPVKLKAQGLISHPTPAQMERPSRIPGLRFRVQSDPVGQSITPRATKTAIDTLPPGVGPSEPEHVPLRADENVAAAQSISAPPPPPPSTSAADLNYRRVLQLRRELRALKTLQNKHERELVAPARPSGDLRSATS